MRSALAATKLNTDIRTISEEHVIFLTSHLKMKAGDIIRQYTGIDHTNATIDEAIESVYIFNLESARRYGFTTL